MKIEVRWRGEPASETVSGTISRRLGRPLLPEKVVFIEEEPNLHALTFECQSLSEFLHGDPPLSMTAGDLAHTIRLFLIRDYGVQDPKIWINGIGLVQYAIKSERYMIYLRVAALNAVDMLKATRSWFKDRRFQAIRLGLERGLHEHLFF